MPFDLKKLFFHYIDKVAFGLALVVFVFSAYFSIRPASDTDIFPAYGEPKEKIEQILKKEEIILTGLVQPSIPDDINKGGFATDPDLIYPRANEIQCDHCLLIVPEDTEVCPHPKCGKPLKSPVVEKDTDGDGIPDSWEEQYPLYADFQTADADRDPDGDGFTNLEEYQGSSHPGDRASIPIPIMVTAIMQKKVDIKFGGRIKQGDGSYALLINWGKGTRARFIKPGTTFRGYMFDNPKEVWLRYKDGTKRKALMVTIQKMVGSQPIGSPKRLLEGKFIPEDELSANFQIIRGPDKGKKFNNQYVEDTIEVDDKIYIIQNIEKERVLLKEKETEDIIVLYSKK